MSNDIATSTDLQTGGEHSPQDRRCDLDIARALACMLVVIVHECDYLSRYIPGSIQTLTSRHVEYILLHFHIPTFMLVAGFVAGLGRKMPSLARYPSFIWGKFCRLMLPFLAVSLLQGCIKTAAGIYNAQGFLNAGINSLIAPHGGLAGHLWFLYCLMSIFLVWPAINSIMHTVFRIPVLVMLVLLAILPIPWPSRTGSDILGLAQLTWWLPIFALGYLYGDKLLPQKPRKWTILALMVIVTATLVLHFMVTTPRGLVWDMLHRAIRFLGHLTGGLFIIRFSSLLNLMRNRLRNVLLTLGLYSYDVYLLHVALVGHPLTYLLGLLHPALIVSRLLSIPMFFAMTFVPVGLGVLIRRIPRLAFVVVGVPMPKKKH